MKKIMWLFLGFALATLAYFALVYIVGILAENLRFSLYNSESDQQRNFNIVMSFWVIISTVAGFILSVKKS